jgi:hypothetical protein
MTDQKTPPGAVSSLADMLGALKPNHGPARTEPSEVRRQIRENFDAITAARARGVAWQAIALTMGEAGVRAADGAEIGWRALKSLFHAERYGRGAKPKRRSTRKAVAPASPPALAAKAELPQAVQIPAEPRRPGPPQPDDDRDEAERAARLRAALARPVRKPFPTGGGFEVPTDPNWRKGE